MVERISSSAERARLDALRLECLKLAHSRDVDLSFDENGAPVAADYFAVAREMFDYVTNTPTKPILFVVRLLDGSDDIDPDKKHLNISGSHPGWGHEIFAYRFRSEAEAETAVARHRAELFVDRPLAGWMTEALPDHVGLF